MRATLRGKRRRPDVAWFLFRFESELERIRRLLRERSWRPCGFELLFVREPKPRLIARAPIEDRIVHGAIVDAIEPLFARSYSADAFACRRGMGTHRALLRILEHTRRFDFALHLDIKSYFASIDLDVLRALIARRVRDSAMLELIERVLRSGAGLFDSPRARRFAHMASDWPPPGRGLPIGARTSQLFAAQVYLCAFDHFVKRELKVPGYVRYVDDLYLFGDSRVRMRRWRARIAEWLERERHLRLKAPNARILSCRGHVDALGHRVTREGVEPLPRKPFERITSRVRDEFEESGRRADIASSVSSSAAHIFFGC